MKKYLWLVLVPVLLAATSPVIDRLAELEKRVKKLEDHLFPVEQYIPKWTETTNWLTNIYYTNIWQAYHTNPIIIDDRIVTNKTQAEDGNFYKRIEIIRKGVELLNKHPIELN